MYTVLLLITLFLTALKDKLKLLVGSSSYKYNPVSCQPSMQKQWRSITVTQFNYAYSFL